MKPRWVLVSLLILLLVLQISPTSQGLIVQVGGFWQDSWGDGGADVSRGIALDSGGNVYLVGSNQSLSYVPASIPTALLIMKYASNGSRWWAKIWNGGNILRPTGTSITLDRTSQRIYATGSAVRAGITDDCQWVVCDAVIILAFDLQGNLLWQRAWGGIGLSQGLGVASDSFGNLYLTGYASNNAGVKAILLKFSSSGSLVWQKTWGNGNYVIANGVVTDSAGNVYVAGTTDQVGAGDNDAFLLKFDGGGNLQWQRTWGGGSGEWGTSISIDSLGYVYEAGFAGIPLSSAVTQNGPTSAFLLKYDPFGDLIWQRIWSDGRGDEAYGVAADVSGGVYVAGESGNGNVDCHYDSAGCTSSSLLLLKFASNGTSIWARTNSLGEPPVVGGVLRNRDQEGYAVAVDPSGVPYVAGLIRGPIAYNVRTVTGSIREPAFGNYTPGLAVGSINGTVTVPTATISTPSEIPNFPGDIFLQSNIFVSKGMPAPSATPSFVFWYDLVLGVAVVTIIILTLTVRSLRRGRKKNAASRPLQGRSDPVRETAPKGWEPRLRYRETADLKVLSSRHSCSYRTMS